MREIKFRAWRKGKEKMYCVRALYSDGWVTLDDVDGSFAPDTVELMQYIGLKDKNGKEIYEEDIIRFELSEMGYTETGIMEFIESGFWMKSPNGQLHLPAIEYREVIGNIYESPDLLKE